MSTIPIDIEFLERISSPPIITVFIVILLTIIYVNIQHSQYDPLELVRQIIFGPSLKITSLRIYPIKSCRGIQVSSRKLLKSGLELDRNWMFMDVEKKKFITIREHSLMTLIDTVLVDGMLRIHVHGSPASEAITIPAPPSQAWLEEHCVLEPDVEIWGEKTDGWVYHESFSAPVSKLLGSDVRLVYKGPKPRIVWGDEAQKRTGREQSFFFADMCSVLVGSENSLEELNQRLKANGHNTLTIERFRPNIIVRGGKPWMEDDWKRLRITSSKTQAATGKPTSLGLDVPNRCLRCQVPNVDPDTGNKHKSQPWGILTKYRNIDKGKLKGKPVFGMLCIPTEEGDVEVGMRLKIVETTENHAFSMSSWKDL
ncbi:MAG: hypothetical protein M1822_000374 [Bathelium mastoideum]|nr:MAG: hypothetical protein M1822_000374 [Bathelium mastoideum]